MNIVFSGNQNKSTDSLSATYYDAAQFYLGWKKNWISEKSIFEKNSSIVEIPFLESHDIDNEEDWKLSKKLWKFFKN